MKRQLEHHIEKTSAVRGGGWECVETRDHTSSVWRQETDTSSLALSSPDHTRLLTTLALSPHQTSRRKGARGARGGGGAASTCLSRRTCSCSSSNLYRHTSRRRRRKEQEEEEQQVQNRRAKREEESCERQRRGRRERQERAWTCRRTTSGILGEPPHTAFDASKIP